MLFLRDCAGPGIATKATKRERRRPAAADITTDFRAILTELRVLSLLEWKRRNEKGPQLKRRMVQRSLHRIRL